GHGAPEALALLAARRSRLRREALALNLYLDLGALRQIAIPAGVLRRPALRRDDDMPVAVAAEDERRRRLRAGAPPGGRQQQRRGAVPDVADLAVGLAIAANVLLAEERPVDHDGRVAARSGGGPRPRPPTVPGYFV